MRIGIYIDNWKKQAGGGYAYAKTLVEYFSAISSHHEFIFIVAVKNNETPESYGSLDRVVQYNPYDSPELKMQQLKNKKNVKSLSRLLKTCNFFVDRMGLNSLTFIREKINNRIENYNQLQSKDPTIFRKLIEKENIHCVYYTAAFVCEDADIPFYTTIWDLGHLNISVFPEVSRNGEFESRQGFLNTIVHRAYKIISESESGKADICYYYRTKPEKVIVIPQFPSNLINIELSEAQVISILKKFNLENRSFLFYPAQFWPHKNHINLIKSLELLKKDGIEIELILSGSDQGNLQYVKDYLKTTDVSAQVRYIGFVTDEEMKVLYSNALAMVFFTLLGPTNMPIAEAISLGCPVICSDFQGHREQAKDAALYVVPEDVEAMKAQIKTVIEDGQLRDKLIRRGLEVSKDNRMDKAFSDLLVSFDEFEKIRSCWKS